eukprot:IDg1377t1
MSEDGIVDNFVLVDTHEALIFDCAEDHPIALAEEALRWCAGDDTSNPRDTEAGKLVEQRTTTSSRQVAKTFKSAACDIDLVNPSARTAWTSIIVILDVFVPFEMTSNNSLLSVTIVS